MVFFASGTGTVSSRALDDNIADDIKEENDLAKVHPDKVEELLRTLVAWEKEMGVEEYSGVQ